MDENNYWENPPARLGITSWAEWYPAPGTALDMLYKVLEYAISRGVHFASTEDALKQYGNILTIGHYNKNNQTYTPDTKMTIPASYNNYCVIGANGSVIYKSVA